MQAFPQDGLVVRGADRRGHHVLRALETGPFRAGVVEHQMRDHRLHKDVDAPLPGGDRLIERRFARGVHDVDVAPVSSANVQR